MEIYVELKNVYGNELIYPFCDNAKKFCNLLNKKTLTMRDILIIKTLGYKVKMRERQTTEL